MGVKIGRRTVVETGLRIPLRSEKAVRVRCDCGTENVVSAGKLRRRLIDSCGCAQREIAGEVHTTHGLSKDPLYGTWKMMRARCQVPTTKQYADYGGRGIRVCEQWEDVSVFLADIARVLGMRPEGCTLDRIDNDGNYEPGNVRWASREQQVANRR